jgi:hypothetical protein
MANGASASGTCGFEPFVHDLQVVAQRKVTCCTEKKERSGTTQGRPRHDLWTKLR